jgi:hypothetical protein
MRGIASQKVRNRKKLWAVTTIGILVGAFLGYKYLLSSMTLSACGYQLLSEVPSPDGEYLASVSERNCGAMSGYARIVSLRHRTAAFHGDDEASWVFLMLDQPTLEVRWSSKRHLTVKTQGYSQTPPEKALRRTLWQDVSISNVDH